jgi:hypothetical protein
MLGAAVMLISVFLPRVESNTFLRVAENTLIQSGAGWWFLGLTVSISLAAWFAYQRRAGGAGPMLLGLVAVGIAIYYGTNKGSLTLCPINSDAASTLGISCSKASPGIGIYAAGVGGVLAALGGWQIWRSDSVEIADEEEEPSDSSSSASTSSGSDLLAERLRVLDNLRDQGLLADDEHQQRRSSLLDEIAPRR